MRLIQLSGSFPIRVATAVERLPEVEGWLKFDVRLELWRAEIPIGLLSTLILTLLCLPV